jgi:hypothetical protein
MSDKKKKVKNWEDIDEECQQELLQLRALEKDYKDKSGYNTWFKYFTSGSIIYAFIYYNLIFKKQSNKLSIKSLLYLIIPLSSYSFLLTKLYFDKESFLKYYQTHLELNRSIKKISKSSEYK